MGQYLKYKIYGMCRYAYRSLPIPGGVFRLRIRNAALSLFDRLRIIPLPDAIPRTILVDQDLLLANSNKFTVGIGLTEHLGDIVACEPVSRYVRRSYPNAEITWVTRQEYASLLSGNPHIDRVEVVECLTGWIRFLKHGHFNVVVDLHVDGRICQSCRVPLEKNKGDPAITGETYFNYGSLLRAFSLGAGLPPLDETPEMYIPADASEMVDSLTLPQKYIALHRTANTCNGYSKEWDNHKWWRAITTVLELYPDMSIVEVGAEPLKGEGCDDARYIDLTGRLSIMESAEVIRRARLFVGVDSGPAHMANAARTPGVILLGDLPPFSNYMPYSGYYAQGGARIIRDNSGSVAKIAASKVVNAITKALSDNGEATEGIGGSGARCDNAGDSVRVFEGNGGIEAEADPVKLIAFYLPQFHPIPENDKAWGRGFTEWRNVALGKPWFSGHYQPRVPADLGFYDLRLPETMVEQAKLAMQNGVDGFCYYYYWFNGKRPLALPIDSMLKNPEINIPFCLCWANESWTRRWDGGNREIIIEQRHNANDDRAFMESILSVFEDERYIKVNGKPLLLVYRTELFSKMWETTELWRKMARGRGWRDLFLVRCEGFDNISEPADVGFDASYEVPTFILPDALLVENRAALSIHEAFQGRIFEYSKIVEYYLNRPTPGYRRFRDVMLAWDNTARHGMRATIFHNVRPELYREWLWGSVARARKEHPHGERIVFINAWNEWAEGSYLEPDSRFGKQFLEATREVATEIRAASLRYKERYG